MHILVIPSELYSPPLRPLSGIFQRHQIEVMASRGIDLGVVSCGYLSWRLAFQRFPYPQVERANGVNILRRFIRPILAGRFASVYMRAQLVRQSVGLVEEYVRRFGIPDIVHAHNTFNAGLVAEGVRKKFGIPFMLTEHDSGFAREFATDRGREQAREVLQSAAVLSAVSRSVARQLDEASPGRGGQTLVLGNVLEPLIEDRARAVSIASAGESQTGFAFLAIGNLVEVKNHALLLKAFASAFKGDTTVSLRVGGHGPLEADLKDLARELGINDQVHFLGYLNRDQVIDQIQACNAMVLSSRAETFGVVLIEALAFGKPVLSTRCGGPEDIVDPRVGILVDSDRGKLAEGLKRLYASSFDGQTIRDYCLQSWGAEAFWGRLQAAYAGALMGRRDGAT